MSSRCHRRSFLAAAGCGAGFLLLENSLSVRAYAANARLNVGLIGVTGRAGWFVQTMPQLANVVAMCDVNRHRAGPVFEKFPGPRKFEDFREMLDQMERELDAVTVAIPDHTHAAAALGAIKRRKHVLCEKPLTHDVSEARALREAAAQFKVATQMGNQGTASEAYRQSVELTQAGLLGDIREVYAWKDGGGTGDRPAPAGEFPPPDDLRWDLWLGPAAARPYHPLWMKWHGWRDFATGNLGNWGAHILNLPFRALRLDTLWDADAPAEWRPKEKPVIRIKARMSGIHPLTFPKWELVEFDFPARGPLPPVHVTWANGAGAPGARARVEELMGRKLDWGDAGAKRWDDHGGCLLVGSRGMLHTIAHNTTLTLLPAEKFKDFDLKSIPRALPRSRGHESEWVQACQGGPAALSHFHYAGPLTEFLLLGNVATLFDVPLEYDPLAGRILNHPGADAALRRPRRKGWEL